jgi:hypothetical protein
MHVQTPDDEATKSNYVTSVSILSKQSFPDIFKYLVQFRISSCVKKPME